MTSTGGPDVLAGAILRSARRRPDRHAVVGPDGSVTYGELAARLQAAGARGADPAMAVVPTDNSVASVVEVLLIAARDDGALLTNAEWPAREQAQAQQIVARCFAAGAAGAPSGARLLGIYTSGTLGHPKAVVHRWADFVANAASFAAVAGYDDADRVLVTTPISHAYALGVGVLATIVTGGTVVLAPSPLTPQGLRRTAHDEATTVFQSVPFVYQLLAEGSLTEFKALRLAVSAGSPLDERVRTRWCEGTDAALRNQYGASEFGVITYNDTDVAGSVGRPIPGREVRRAPAPPTEPAEILVAAGPTGGCRYATAAGLSSPFVDGWLAMGDTGFVDDDGTVRLRGRLRERINVAGNKVDPMEVEQSLARAAGVVECRVLGRPARLLGEEVCAFVVGDGPLDPDVLLSHVRSELAGFKVPTRLIQLDALPRTQTGKVLVTRLREMLEA